MVRNRRSLFDPSAIIDGVEGTGRVGNRNPNPRELPSRNPNSIKNSLEYYILKYNSCKLESESR